jgi:carboxymethylenebutenolidase
MDAFLVSYYSDADAAAMKSPDRPVRVAYFSGHLKNWANRVRDIVGFVLHREESSGKIGLLGFSNGGFVAVASAAADPRITALVVFYGGIAGVPKTGSVHLPPLLALHGDADRNVPLAEGTALVERARAQGGSAELVVYPGAGHGFDFDPTRSDAQDASGRALSFLQQQLK